MAGAISFKPLGDAAIRIGLGDSISLEIHRRVQAVWTCLAKDPPEGVIETVPSYNAVTVYYRPHLIRYAQLYKELQRRIESAAAVSLPTPGMVEIPVCYGGDYGPDLREAAKLTGLQVPDLIHRHSAVSYLIYMLGFAPGFPYLGGLDPSLTLPRLSTPRPNVPAGSVGIGGQQTGIYPLQTPGGWHILGRTPLKLFDPRYDPPVLLRAGDYLRFIPVAQDTYLRIEADVARGSFRAVRNPVSDPPACA